MLRAGVNILGSVLGALLLSAGAANAAIVAINIGVLETLSAGNTYQANPGTLAIIEDTNPFTNDYLFQVPSDITTETTVNVHTPQPPASDARVYDLLLAWLDGSGTPLLGASSLLVTNGTGGLTGDFVLSFILPAVATPGTDYILRVTGTVFDPTPGDPSGRYNFDLVVSEGGGPGDVPIPGAMLLFGSVFAGGMLIVRRRRATQTA